MKFKLLPLLFSAISAVAIAQAPIIAPPVITGTPITNSSVFTPGNSAALQAVKPESALVQPLANPVNALKGMKKDRKAPCKSACDCFGCAEAPRETSN